MRHGLPSVAVTLFFSLALLGLALASRPAPAPPVEDRAQAEAAFALLNQVRQDPPAFSQRAGANLRGVRPRPALAWNDTLYQVALARAQDMARRRYFDHVDPNGRGSNILIHEAGYTLRPEWIRNKRQYNFESIAAGDTSASTALLQLIKDPGITPPMHRHHLLGIDAFWADCTHGAVAFVRCAECPFKTYTVVLVAKH